VKRVRAEILSTRTLGAYRSLTLVAPELAERAPGAIRGGRDADRPRFHPASSPDDPSVLTPRGWAGTLEFSSIPPRGRARMVGRPPRA
jgi:hypothetical protein